MTYEKLELVNALMSGEIYLSRRLKNGFMSDNRRIMTKECLRATNGLSFPPTEDSLFNRVKGVAQR